MPEKKKITRKVISKVITDQADTTTAEPEGGVEVSSVPKSKRGCMFCESKTEPKFTDVVALRRFVTDRGRILPRSKSGVCSKHQRRVTKQIKYARHLALLPFTPKV